MGDDEAPRIVGSGTMTAGEIKPITGAQARVLDLLDLQAAGYEVFKQDDLDRRYAPWLIAPDESYSRRVA